MVTEQLVWGGGVWWVGVGCLIFGDPYYYCSTMGPQNSKHQKVLRFPIPSLKDRGYWVSNFWASTVHPT